MEKLKATLMEVIERALTQNIASSISLFTGFGAEDSAKDIVLHRGISHASPLTPTSDQTIYDLASLTKIIGTTIAIAQAISDGKASLNEEPFRCWPQVTLRSLLSHTSGLPAHRRFYHDLNLDQQHFANNRHLIFEELFAMVPQNATSERVYSDLGFMALGWLLEQRLAKPLYDIFSDAWRRSRIDGDFLWFPSRPQTFTSENVLVAPTGLCRQRKRRVLAQVHDPNCYFMGGLAGHAGLFGTTDSVKKLGQFFLRTVKEPLTKTESRLAAFARKGLGFDKPTRAGTTRHLSPHAFGHFGYTGTSLWIDPAANRQRGLIIALLTNRVNCSELPEGIFNLRLAVNQAIFRHVDNI